jgi:hypothetical protein
VYDQILALLAENNDATQGFITGASASIEAANTATQSANNAADSANAIAQDLTEKRDSGFFKGEKGDTPENVVLHTKQTLTPEQQAQARENIGVIDPNTKTASGEFVTIRPEAGTSVKVISEITGMDASYIEADKLVLRQIKGKNLFDIAELFGGAGTEYEINGLHGIVNDNGTMTITGTNTNSGWTNVVYKNVQQADLMMFPAGTYSIPTGLTLGLIKADSKWTSMGNKTGTFTVDTPFVVKSAYIAFVGGATVNVTIPLMLVAGETLPTSDYAFHGVYHTARFSSNVSNGIFNWQTGVLTDTNGNVIETLPAFDRFPALDGENTFFTGAGNTTVTYTATEEADLYNADQYGLPILYLSGSTKGMTKDDSVDLEYVYGEMSGTCSVKWQGSSSLSYPKKNYTVKFDQAFEAADGWGSQKKYCLKANFIDHSHARNIVNAKLWGQIVKQRSNADARLKALVNGGAVDGFPVIIVLNGKFHGLYTFNIPKDGWMYGMGSGTKEAIVCADTHCTATQFKGTATLNGDFDLEYATDENNAGWVKTSLNNLINACINSDGTDLDTTISTMLDWESAIDYYIFTVLVCGHDMTDKNYLLSTYDGTKWFFGAYDMDSTHGLHWNGGSWMPYKGNPSVNEYAAIHRVMNLIRHHKWSEFKARFYELTDSVLSEENVSTMFNNFAGKIPAQVYAQDAELYPVIPNTSVNNVGQIRDYYRRRLEIIKHYVDNP